MNENAQAKSGVLDGLTLAETDKHVLESQPLPKIPNGELGFRDNDIAAALSDVASITGEPIKGTGRRGRKPGSKNKTADDKNAEASQAALTIAGIDAKQIEGTLTEVYLQGLTLLARCPLIVTDERKKSLGPLITACANQYIPGDYLKHAAIVGLVVVSFDIVRESRKQLLEGGMTDGNK